MTEKDRQKSSTWYAKMEEELLGKAVIDKSFSPARKTNDWYEQNVIELLDNNPTLPLPPPKDPPTC